MYRVFNNEASEHISTLYTHTLSHAIPTLRTISLVCLGKVQTYSKQECFSQVPFYGTTYNWQTDLVSHSAPSSEDFVHTLNQLHRMDCDIILLGREKQTVKFSSDCHCNDWSVETYFIHPQISAQSFLIFVRVSFFFSFFPFFFSLFFDKISIECFSFLFPILVVWIILSDHMFYCPIYWLYAHNV